MGELEIGKDLARLEDRLGRIEVLMEQVFKVLEHNVKTKKLEEPPEPKEEGKKN